MNEQKVSPELAAAEIAGWLDYKKVSAKKRESYKDAIETLTEAIVEGHISIGEDHTITHRLLFPLDGFASELVYTPRITVGDLTKKMQGVKAGDADGRIMAYAAALTGLSVGLLAKLDTEDNSICQAVAVFFV